MIAFAASGLPRRQPGGGASSATPWRRSPAVVIAALPPSDLGNPSRQIVGAVMAAQQRHGDAAVLGHRDHRRLPRLSASSGANERISTPAAQMPTIGRPAANSCLQMRSRPR